MKALSLVFLFLLAACSFAVDSFDAHCAGVALLQDKSVQKEIGITEQQRAQMNKFAEQNRTQLQAYQRSLAGKPPDMKVLTGYMEQLKNNVQSVMSAGQIKRLRELNLQAAGLLGLLDKMVATRVGLSDTQFKQLTKLYADGQNQARKLLMAALLPINQKYQKLAAPYKGKEAQHQADLQKLSKDYQAEAGSAQKRIQPQVQSISKQTEKKMLAVLSAKQKANWEALKGKKFTPSKSK